MSEIIKGTVHKIIFQKNDTGYCVFDLQLEDKSIITVLSNSFFLTADEEIETEGQWIVNPKYGKQFKAHYVKRCEPTTISSIQSFLASGIISGIGPIYAKKLVEKFKEKIFDILNHTPEKIKSISGIGESKYQTIIESWIKHKAIKDILLFLHEHKIPTSKASILYDIYGEDTISILKENPYKLVEDIKGIGFLKADEIATKLNKEFPKDFRVKAGFNYVMNVINTQGHTACPLNDFIQKTKDLLNSDEETVKEALTSSLDNNDFYLFNHHDTHLISSDYFFDLENQIAETIQRRLDLNITYPNQSLDFYAVSEKTVTLNDEQEKALNKAICNHTFILTGGPGVGKTTITKFLIDYFIFKDKKIALAAPTGRASKRLSEVTNQEVLTLHRLLEVDPYHQIFKKNESNKIDCDVLIIDEVSMVDTYLFSSLLKALKEKTQLILIGDSDQLPSVGPGNILAALLQHSKIPSITLKTIFRQSEQSDIILNAHKINEGILPNFDKKNKDFFFVKAETSDEALAKIKTLLFNKIPKAFNLNPVEDIQILSPMNKGPLGVINLNHIIQNNFLKQNTDSYSSFSNNHFTFFKETKIIHLINDYENDLYNGDIGFIVDIDKKAETLKIKFDKRIIDLPFTQADQIMPAYALTIHKSQGSEYPAVLIIAMAEHLHMLNKKLLYTAITRGKRLTILIGSQSVLEKGIKENKNSKRWSCLPYFLSSL